MEAQRLLRGGLGRARTLVDRAYSRAELAGTPRLLIVPRYGERLVLREVSGLLTGRDLVVYDVGAASGTFAAAAASLRDVSCVFAFEPLPNSFSQLQKRAQGNPKLRCFNVALGDERGAATLFGSSVPDTSSLLIATAQLEELVPTALNGGEVAVEVVTLDDFVDRAGLPPPDLVKIDVQGFEDRVIRGGERTIACADYCVIELSFERLYHESPLFDDIHAQLHDLGFRLAGFFGRLRDARGRILQTDGIFERADRRT